MCFSVSMIFAGFIVLIVGAYSSSIYGFITGAFVDGVTAGATYHPSTEQVTIQDRAAVVAVTMAGGSEDYEDLDDLSHPLKTPLDGSDGGQGLLQRLPRALPPAGQGPPAVHRERHAVEGRHRRSGRGVEKRPRRRVFAL